MEAPCPGRESRSTRLSHSLRAEFEIPVNLGYGNYSVTVSLHAGADHLEGNYDWWDNVLTFQVVPGTEPYFVGTSFVPSSVSLDVVS